MTISAIVLAKNEETMLAACLKSLSFCDEIVMIDSGSTDKTVAIAKEHNARVYEDTMQDFAEKRNLGKKKATGEWLLYIDADERVTPALKEDILKQVADNQSGITTFKVRRKNFYLGNHPWPHEELMERLFRKDSLEKWHGALHESPVFSGEAGILGGELLHYTHRDLTEMVSKTNKWSDTEARLRYDHHHPRMSWWRFPRVMISAFTESYFRQGGIKAGTAGLVESIYQAFSMFITYAKLWELQQVKHQK